MARAGRGRVLTGARRCGGCPGGPPGGPARGSPRWRRSRYTWWGRRRRGARSGRSPEPRPAPGGCARRSAREPWCAGPAAGADGVGGAGRVQRRRRAGSAGGRGAARSWRGGGASSALRRTGRGRRGARRAAAAAPSAGLALPRCASLGGPRCRARPGLAGQPPEVRCGRLGEPWGAAAAREVRLGAGRGSAAAVAGRGARAAGGAGRRSLSHSLSRADTRDAGPGPPAPQNRQLRLPLAAPRVMSTKLGTLLERPRAGGRTGSRGGREGAWSAEAHPRSQARPDEAWGTLSFSVLALSPNRARAGNGPLSHSALQIKSPELREAKWFP